MRLYYGLVLILAAAWLVSQTPLFGQWQNNSEREQYLNRVQKKWSLQDDDGTGQLSLSETLLAQSFSIPPGADINLVGQGGSRLFIPARALRNHPAGRLRVVLYEVQQPIDFYLAGVDLSFGNQILQSGGMAKFEVYDDRGQRVNLNPRLVRLELPRLDNDSYGTYIRKNGQWIEKSKSSGALFFDQPTLLMASASAKRAPVLMGDILIGDTQPRAPLMLAQGANQNPDGFEDQQECPDNECFDSPLRIFEGAEPFTWLNFDKPLPQVACLTASVAGGQSAKGFHANFVGLSRRTMTGAWNKSANMTINAIQNTSGVLIVEAHGGLMGQKKLTVPAVDGYTRGGAKVSGRCSSVGTISLVQVPKEVRKDKVLLKNFLGL